MEYRLLLFLSAERLHAQLMAGRQIKAQHEFVDSPEGRSRFNDFLQTVACPAYLLADLIEEDFRHEVIPHLNGKKRTTLLQRKFEQFYRSTPFHQATLLQRQKTGRRDDDMLFSALTNPSLITPWLDIMLARQIPLAGIYSVPQISAPLVRDHPSNYLLLISWEKYSGLRQTYFREHRLQVSRLTPVSDQLSFQDTVVRELSRTYEYLKNLSLLPSGQILDVRLLGHSHDLLELQLELPRNADMRYDFIELEDIARQLKIEHRFADSDASQIFLHQLAANPPRFSYARPEHTRYNTLAQLRRTLNWISAALLLGSLLWSGASAWQSRANEQETVLLKNQTQQLASEARQITLTFPGTQASASDMKSAVSSIRSLKRIAPSPDEMWRTVSAALDRHPQIMLDEFSWQPGATKPSAGDCAAGSHAQTVALHGHLIDFATDYRAALNYLEHFEHELAAQGYRVAVLKKPLDASANGSITDPQEAHESLFGFSLELSCLKQPGRNLPS